MRVRVDRNGCMSSGRCIAAAPDVFTFDADRLAPVELVDEVVGALGHGDLP